MNRIARGTFTGIVLAISCLLILISQNIMDWIKFMPSNIGINIIIYTVIAAFFIGAILSITLKTLNPEQEYHNKSGVIGTFIRWFLYNLFGAIFTVSWSLFAMIGLNANFLDCFLKYGLIAFIIVNSLFLIMHTILKNSNSYLESVFISAALAASFYCCNNYFATLNLLQNQHSLSVLIVGAVILSLIGCFIHSQRAFSQQKDKQTKSFSNYIGFESSVVCTLLGVFVFGITGIGLAYSNSNLPLVDIIIPIMIIGGLFTINFIFANSVSFKTTYNEGPATNSDRHKKTTLNRGPGQIRPARQPNSDSNQALETKQ